MDPESTQPEPLQDFLTWLEGNKVRVASIAGAVALVIALTSFFIYNEGQREIRASEALSEIRTPLNPLEPLSAETRSELFALAESRAGTAAAGRALLRVAGSDFVSSNYVEAQSLFDRFLREYANSPWVDQATLGVASSLEAQDQFEAAASKYEDVRTRFANSAAVADQATLGLARIYEYQGKNEEAIKLYHSLSESSQGSIGNRAMLRKDVLIERDPSLTNAFAPILPSTPATPPTPTVTSTPIVRDIPSPTTVSSTAPNTATGVVTSTPAAAPVPPTTNTIEIPPPVSTEDKPDDSVQPKDDSAAPEAAPEPEAKPAEPVPPVEETVPPETPDQGQG